MKLPKLKQLLEIRLCSRIRVSIFLPFVILCSFICGYQDSFIAAYTAALLHELAHIVCSRFLGVGVSHITLYPFGINARLSAEYMKDSSKEFAIALSGPLFSLVLFWISNYLLHFTHISLFRFWGDVNLALCVVNLIPALPLDGGRMFKSVLSARFGTVRAYNLSVKLSRVLIILMSAFALTLFFLSGFNFSLILISAFLFRNLSYENSSIPRIALDEILTNTQKPRQRRFYTVKTFLVAENSRASHILRLLSYDYYCIIHITDDNSRILRTVTETEVINALIKKGSGIKFAEI